MTSLDFALGVAVGLAVSGGAFAAIWILLRAQRRRIARQPPSLDPPGVPLPNGTNRAESTRAPVPIGDGTASEPVRSDTVPDPLPPRHDGIRPASTSADRVAPASRTGEPAASPEPAVQLSHRVLLHLYRQGVLPASEVAPPAFSQAGMIAALHVRQGTLAGVLQRLEAAGVVSSETAHVRGGPRRVKVYRLTDRGVALARGLQLSGPSPREPRPRG